MCRAIKSPKRPGWMWGVVPACSAGCDDAVPADLHVICLNMNPPRQLLLEAESLRCASCPVRWSRSSNDRVVTAAKLEPNSERFDISDIILAPSPQLSIVESMLMRENFFGNRSGGACSIAAAAAACKVPSPLLRTGLPSTSASALLMVAAAGGVGTAVVVVVIVLAGACLSNQGCTDPR